MDGVPTLMVTNRPSGEVVPQANTNAIPHADESRRPGGDATLAAIATV